MKHHEDTATLLKRLTAAALRAVAGRGDVGVAFAPGESDIRGNRVRLPSPTSQSNKPEIARLRGTADALALILRYHDDGLHRKRMPTGQHAREVYDAIEQVRAMVARTLNVPLDVFPKELDGSDGVAVALCHHFAASSPRMQRGPGGWKAFLADNPDRIR